MEMELKEGETLQEINESLRLISRRDGLTFGTDAYMLSAFVRPNAGKIALDLGSGTGVISLLIKAKEKCDTVYAAEIQPDFAELIERNARLNALEDSIRPVLRDVRALTIQDVGGRNVDYIVSNPPYMKTTSGKANASSAKTIARHEVMGDIGDFCAAASKLVKSGGFVYIVYRPDRLSDLMAALRDHRLEPKRMVLVAADAASEPSMVLVEAQRDAAVGLRMLPTIFLFEEGTNKQVESTLSKTIYEHCQIPDSVLKI